MTALLTRRATLLGAGGLAALRPAAASALRPIREQDALIAFGHTGPVTDGGWTHQHDLGVEAVRAAFPRLKTIFVESIPYSADATRIFRQFVAEGAQMVMATSNYGDFIRDVADRAPEVAFMECDGRNVSGNLGWYYITHWYASYIIGIAAGLLSKSGRLGYVASFPISSVYAGANATLLGAQSVNPNATMQVISINAWFDPQGANQAGAALVDSGCDFLCGIMDEPAYLRVAQERHVWAAMWNTDMRRFGPDAYVSSVTLDFAPYYVQQIGDRLRGTWRPDAHFLTLGHGVDRDAWGRNVPESVRMQADAARTKMLAGWSPFVGPIHDASGRMRVAPGQTMDDMALYSWDWPLRGVSGLA
ncbi:BMP family ABC transporter substrate-binding protein [Tanticharoenia sakaeratensis]|uniref:Lipoprotein n=1 Tax=Tanticharoenia sakaeratensis NBRC 103193 TaxID=1231623 RepID=A0A0D6MKZ9_9PROT|nr:lipoprotein [Tanticharoenia sakaeratensis NBRC 103193]GBQ18916.1 basic membrane lipoprotein [Tanticharoenia sakaeratensis NBRC 103193]